MPGNSQVLKSLELWLEMLHPGSSFPSRPGYAGGSEVELWSGGEAL